MTGSDPLWPGKVWKGCERAIQSAAIEADRGKRETLTYDGMARRRRRQKEARFEWLSQNLGSWRSREQRRTGRLVFWMGVCGGGRPSFPCCPVSIGGCCGGNGSLIGRTPNGRGFVFLPRNRPVAEQEADRAAPLPLAGSRTLSASRMGERRPAGHIPPWRNRLAHRDPCPCRPVWLAAAVVVDDGCKLRTLLGITTRYN